MISCNDLCIKNTIIETFAQPLSYSKVVTMTPLGVFLWLRYKTANDFTKRFYDNIILFAVILP